MFFLSLTSRLTGGQSSALPSPRAERVVRALEDAQTPKISDLFNVHQGIQTGLNDALLLTGDEWSRLPLKERRFFRRATMSDSIQNGKVERPYYVFFPHTPEGPLFRREADVEAALPMYFERYLDPFRARLAARATIRQSKREDWWGLMRPREWSQSTEPRIISKFFASQGGFAGDYDAQVHFQSWGMHGSRSCLSRVRRRRA